MDNYFKLANSIIREHAHLEAPKLEIKLAGKPFTKITPKGGNKTIVSVAGGEPMSISLPMQKVIEIGKDVGLWDGKKVNTKAINGPDAWDAFDYLVKRIGGKIMGESTEDLKEYVGPALTPANQIAKKFGGKVKAINVKDEKGKKTKMFYAEDEDEIEEAVNFSDVEKVMKWAKKNIKAKKFEISKKNKIAFIEVSSDNIFMLHTMRRGELSVIHDTRGISGKSGTAKEYEFTKDNAAEEVIKLISKILGIKEDTLEEAIDPRKFALGGNTKATKRDVDAILSKIFMDTKLAKQVEDSKAYQAGYKAKGKGKNPYKKDTADFHLYILGQQSAQSE